MPRLFPALLLTLACSSAQAESSSLLADYHPLGGKPPLVPLVACTDLKSSEPGLTRQSCATRLGRSSVTHDRRDPERITLTLTPASGKPLNIALETMPMYLERMYAADLNRDGREDYLLELPWGGNGIGGEGSAVVIALSNASGYWVSAIDTLLFDPFAVVRDGAGVSVIHTALLSAVGKDRKDHSFWVHHLLHVRADRLLESARAPVWVQFTNRPRAVPTTLLSEAEKKRAWKGYSAGSEGIFIRVKVQ